MNKKKAMLMIIIAMFICQFSISFIPNHDFSLKHSHIEQKHGKFGIESKLPFTSDISGNELYAEQVHVELAGEEAVVRQSLLTNDTNIFSQIDLSDPAFFDSSLFIECYNGNPSPLQEKYETSSPLNNLKSPNQYFNGFLLYSNTSSLQIVENRKSRAINIIENLLQVDVIEYNTIKNASWGYFYPFFAHSPKWDTYFDITLSNLPKDGYWKILDINRLLSDQYQTQHYLSSQILYLKDYDMFEEQIQHLPNYDVNLGFDISMAESTNPFTQVLTGGLTSGLGDFTNNDNSDFEEDINNSENASLDSFLTDVNNLISYSIQYEIVSEGIQSISESNKVFFSLFNSLNIKSTTLPVSEKVYNSFDGITLSTVSIALYEGEVSQIEPTSFNIDNEYLKQIENLLFFFDDNINISSLQEYSFSLHWKSTEGFHKLMCQPENRVNSSDLINLLSILAPQQSFINLPSAFIEPLTDINFTYSPIVEEPTLSITKNLTSGRSFRILDLDNTPEITLFIENQGNITAWGLERNLSAIGIINNPVEERNIGDLSGNFFDLLGYETERIIDVTTTLGYDIDELFPNYNPRFFSIDSNGTGTEDILIPELINLQSLFNFQDTQDIFSLFTLINRIHPYSPEFTQLLIDNAEAYGPIADNPQAFNSSDSIFNPQNWIIKPNENLTIELSNPVNAFNSNFTEFYSNFVKNKEGISPLLNIGSQINHNTIEATYSPNEGETWDCQAESLGSNYEIEQTLLFQNNSQIPLDNNTIDSFNISVLFNTNGEEPVVNLEIYNFQSEEFELIPDAYDSENFGIINITFPIVSDGSSNIHDYIDNSSNYSILIKLNYENDENFRVYTDFIKLGYMDLIDEKVFMDSAIITYGTEQGNNQYRSKSNSLLLSTDDSASIIINSKISPVMNNFGEKYRYNISVSNLGNIAAENLKIIINQPGFLPNVLNITNLATNTSNRYQGLVNNFTLNNGYLVLNLDRLGANSSISNITFDFFLTNNRLSPPVIAEWQYSLGTNTISKLFTSQSEQKFLRMGVSTTDISQFSLKPHVSIRYININDIGIPCPQDNLTLSLEIENHEKYPIYGLSYFIPKNLTGFKSLNQTQQIFIPRLNSQQKLVLNIDYQKISAGAYIFPQPNLVCTLQPNMTHCNSSPPLILGNFSVSLIKTYDSLTVTQKETIDVSITLINDGTIELGAFSINDLNGFPADGFELVQGVQVRDYSCLLPGENITLSYTIQASRSEGIYTMNPAFIEYMFIYQNRIESATIYMKINANYWKQFTPLLSTILFGALGLFMAYRYQIKRNRELLDYQRRESLYFGQDLRETAWHRKNIKEFLDSQLKKTTNPLSNPEERS